MSLQTAKSALQCLYFYCYFWTSHSGFYSLPLIFQRVSYLFIVIKSMIYIFIYTIDFNVILLLFYCYFIVILLLFLSVSILLKTRVFKFFILWVIWSSHPLTFYYFNDVSQFFCCGFNHYLELANQYLQGLTQIK